MRERERSGAAVVCMCVFVPLLLLWRCAYVPIWYRLRVGRLLLFERRLDFGDIIFVDKLAVADELTAVLDELCLGGGAEGKGRWCEWCEWCECCECCCCLCGGAVGGGCAAPLSYRLYISRDDLIEVIKELALLPICTPNV